MARLLRVSVFAIVTLITRTVELLGALVAGSKALSAYYAAASRWWRRRRRRASGSPREGVRDERDCNSHSARGELHGGASVGDAVRVPRAELHRAHRHEHRCHGCTGDGHDGHGNAAGGEPGAAGDDQRSTEVP